ncbi:phage tail sheath family protein [Bacillus solitudinis]|uniref:phage tail sheath family protein n=1 Tax=Bacillus solitudinis TaxID=2014074 RepID=UPI000C242DE3|nr:phage tail protein [Bacillus solitudinis]
MAYEHGITILENPTSIQQPVEALSSIQVVFGTAPINLAEDMSLVVNEPILARTFDEAKRKLGYSDDWEKYTLCQSMDATFKQMKVSPIVFVNVLDPATHKEAVASLLIPVVNQESKIEQEGILLGSLVVKSSDGLTTYIKDTDYIANFNTKGHVIISVLSGGSISGTELQVDFDKLNPTAVTNADIIGGYDSATNTYTGVETVTLIYPKLNVVPTILLAPGFSHHSEVGAIIVAKSQKINGSFNASTVLDVTGVTKENAITNKETNLYDDKSSIICWPKAKIRGKTYWYSAIVAARMARTDAENESVPFKSPSNKRISISAMVNDNGQEVFLDQVQGNVLNAKGIITAVNMNGWRIWGNNTAAFDADAGEVMDPKDRFIAVRRMFDWWGNSFIQNYFDKVDDSTNYRLIESIVDSENIRANGFQARGQIAGARIEFREADNPTSQILDGKIQFIQKIGFFTPAEEIVNVLEFDPTILTDSLFGGE